METVIVKTDHRGIVFPPSKLAQKWCVGNGVELGAAAHNPFGIVGSLNVAPADDFDFYKAAQVEMCGAYAVVDIVGDGDKIELPSGSQDYFLSSHVIEHCPNPLAIFAEAQRLLKINGVFFMIFPKRDALPSDATKPVSSLSELVAAWNLKYTVKSIPDKVTDPRGHYWRFTLASMLELIQTANEMAITDWVIKVSAETDDKVGNGHLIVAVKKGEVSKAAPEAEAVNEPEQLPEEQEAEEFVEAPAPAPGEKLTPTPNRKRRTTKATSPE